jgi:hypothetical protein
LRTRKELEKKETPPRVGTFFQRLLPKCQLPSYFSALYLAEIIVDRTLLVAEKMALGTSHKFSFMLTNLNFSKLV